MNPEIADVVRRALEEDIGPGDVTSEACVPADRQATGQFIARQPQVIAGVELLPLIYDQCKVHKRSGDRAIAGDVIVQVQGRARALLSRERVALNFLQRLSGVATLAARYVERVAGTGCRVLDTRKTTPGLRRLEKMAAAAGGVTNHRMGLYDAILIKNNHIEAAGGVRAAMEAARNASQLPIEIEVRTREELDEALSAGARHILLDNFEHMMTVVPEVEELLAACPFIKAIVTSREVLNIPVEHIFPVPPLRLPDLKHLQEDEALPQYGAVALFVQRVQTVLPTFGLPVSRVEQVALSWV